MILGARPKSQLPLAQENFVSRERKCLISVSFMFNVLSIGPNYHFILEGRGLKWSSTP